MPSWLPESNTVGPGADEMRTLAMWCSILISTWGNKPSPFPEGCIPMPGDDEERLTKKINALLI